MKATIIFDLCSTGSSYRIDSELYINGHLHFGDVEALLFGNGKILKNLLSTSEIKKDVCYEVKLEIFRGKDTLTDIKLIEIIENNPKDDETIIKRLERMHHSEVVNNLFGGKELQTQQP